MRQWLTLWGREMGAYFLSPTAYLVAALFLVVTGAGFTGLVVSMSHGPESAAGLTEVSGWGFLLTMTAVAPLLTMRLFAEERRSGTYETLMTAPVTPAKVVTAKFAGAFAFYAAMLLPTAAYGPIVGWLAATPVSADPAAVSGVYVGALLVGGFFLALGVCASAMTRSQLAAGLLTFAFVVLFLAAGAAPFMLPSAGGDRWGAWLSPIVHISDLARGVYDSRPVAFYAINTAWVLFATERLLEWRRWR